MFAGLSDASWTLYGLTYLPGSTLLDANNPLSLLEDVGRLAGKIDAALMVNRL